MKQKLISFFTNLTKRNKIVLVCLIVLVVLLVLMSGSKNKVLTDAQIINNIAALTTIPDIKTDTPFFARLDMSQPQQPFAKGAKTGDIMVIFPISQRAVIYSPTDNRIINQGPIVDDTVKQKAASVQEQVATSTASSSKKATTTSR